MSDSLDAQEIELEEDSINSILDKIQKRMSDLPDSACDEEVIELTEIVREGSKSYSIMRQFLSDDEIKKHFNDALKPYLKSWLRNNLPNVVKDVVESEIKKILRRD